MNDTSGCIVLASPHPRHDVTERHVRRALPAFEIVRVREKEALSPGALAPLEPRYVFALHWSWIIPSSVHERFECIIFHLTDVPYGRGGSPLQNLIVRGHAETKLSAIRCVAELDGGPVYLKRPLSLGGNADEILSRAAGLMGDMVVEIVTNRLKPMPQTGEVVTFKRRRPEDGNLNAAGDLNAVYDYIRMLDGEGYPPAFLETAALRFEFTNARREGEAVEARVRITRKQ